MRKIIIAGMAFLGLTAAVQAQGQLPAHTTWGNPTGSTALPKAMTAAEVAAMCNVFTSTLLGCVPASGGGTATFLRADGTWATSVPGGTAGGNLSGTYPNPTVAKVNGATYPASPSANTVPVVTSAAGGGTITYEAVPNAALANPSMTVNGTTCTLGSSCAPSATAASITVGTTTIVSGTTLRVLFDNAGVLGEYTNTQLTALINPATASLPGALPAWPNNTTTFFRGDGSYRTLNCAALSGSAASCATDATNASNISSGTLAAARGGAGTITGALKGSGAGIVSQAACADLSNGATGCSTSTGTSGATIPLNNGINTESGDWYFGSGSPVCDVRAKGAKGDGSTDDAAAFASCLTTLDGISGGILFVPPGNYCVKSVLTDNNNVGIIVKGAGRVASFIQTCSSDNSIFSFNNSRYVIQDVQLFGSQTVSGAHPVVLFGSSCVECGVFRSLIFGGSTGIDTAGADTSIEDVTITDQYGSAMVHTTQTAWLRRAKIDQAWPQSTPACAATFSCSFSAWSATHTYSLGDVATLSGYLIQVTQAGTSSGSPPSLLSYGSTITDGTVHWLLAAPTTYIGLQVDSGSTQVHASDSDFSCICSSNIQSTQASSGLNLTIKNSVLGGALNSSIFLQTGTGFMGGGLDMAGCVNSGCSLIQIGASFVGNAIIEGSRITGGSNGILIQGGSKTVMNGNIISNTTQGVNVAANVGNFIVVNNTIIGSANGVLVNSGTSDHYNIVNNIVTGSGTGVSDSGSGSNKTISGNN